MDDLTEEQRAAWQQLRACWNNDSEALREIPRAAVLRLTKDEDAVGWRAALPPDYLGQDRHLDIILPSGFPNMPPQFWIEPNAFLSWPHAERNGKLCLWVEGEAPVWRSPSELVAGAVDQFRRIFSLVAAGSDAAVREREFAKEWMSYWRNPEKPCTLLPATVLLTLRPADPVTVLHSARMKITRNNVSRNDLLETTFVIASHDLDALRRWIGNTGVPCDEVDQDSALFIRLREAPSQPGAPHSVESLQAFISTWAEDPDIAQQHLDDLVHSSEERCIWVMFEHDERALAGLYLSPKWGQRKRRHRRHHADAQSNKRPRVGTKFSVMDVQRADAGWVHGRDFDDTVHTLSARHVVLIAVGSLGGFLAENLALSGVGHLTLIDPGTLEVANVGRHALGTLSVGQNKAVALRTRLRADYPHLSIDAFDQSVETENTDIRRALCEADLVVSTTASPSTEQFLIGAQKDARLKGLQLAWSEPFALAGHSALALDASTALSKLFDEGECQRAAIQWSTETETLLPGCGASHIPGAGNRVRLIAAFVAEHTLDALIERNGVAQHRTWVSDSETIANHSGTRLRPSTSGAAILLVDDLSPDSLQKDLASAI